MTYRVLFEPRAAMDLEAVEPARREQILTRVGGLAASPREAPDIENLEDGGYRLRHDDWRVVYEVDDGLHLVFVLKIRG